MSYGAGLPRAPRSQRPARGWPAALFCLIGSALLAALAGCNSGGAPPTARQIVQAELIEPGAPPVQVLLPDDWERSAPQREGAVRYRIVIPDEALRGDTPGVFTARAGLSLRIWLNGTAIATIGSFSKPLPDMSQEPVLVPLPAALVKPSNNVLEIEVHGERRRDAGLAEIWAGPLRELAPMQAREQRNRVYSAYAVGAAATVMALLALLLAVRTRRLPYAYFGVASLLWAWRVAVLTPPTSAPGSAWGPAIETIAFYVSYPWFVSLMTLYGLASIGRETSRARRWVIGWSIVALFMVVANVALNLPLLRTLVSVGMLVMVAGLTVQLFDAAWHEQTQPALLLSAAAVVALFVGLRDFYVFRIAFDYGAQAWSRYTFLILLGVLAWMLVDEFTRSTMALRVLNRDLAQRVEQKERELNLVFEGQRKRDREQATRAERDRILREMHDGLGGRLVAALALTQQVQPGGAVVTAEPAPHSAELAGFEAPVQRVAGAAPDIEALEEAQAQAHEAWSELKIALDDCLVELRLALDSLEVDRRPLVEALAELRFRVEPSLRAAGVRLIWQPSEQLADTELGAGDTLQVLRIVREALTNVIKHAQASVVWLRLEPLADAGGTPRALKLSVIDNGLSRRVQPSGETLPLFVPSAMARGRGLANMERRAAAIGAVFHSGPRAEGWSVELELPLPVAAIADTAPS